MINFLLILTAVTLAYIAGCFITEEKNKQRKSKVEVIYEEWE